MINKAHHYQSLYIDTQVYPDLPKHFCIKQFSPLLKQLILDVEHWLEPWDESSIYGLKAQVLTHEITVANEVPLQVPLSVAPGKSSSLNMKKKQSQKNKQAYIVFIAAH